MEEKEIKAPRRKMTLPNKLTLMRIILIPIMIIIYYIPYLRENAIFLDVSWAFFLDFIVFTVASFTDFFDGYLARKNNQVTTFGKFADPLADKCLVFTSMAILMAQVVTNGYANPEGFKFGKGLMELMGAESERLIPVGFFVIMLIREFMVSGIRMMAAQRGEVIAAGWMGKWKTFITMIAIGFLFFAGLHQFIYITGQVLMCVAFILTITSGIEYLWNSRKLIFESI